MKYFFGIFCALLFTTNLKAEDCKGYIIKFNGDTIRGVLNVPIYKKALNLNKEVQFADMWSGVKFREGTNKEKKYKSTEISGFGLEYSGQLYHFEVYDMQANSGHKAPKFMGKFFNDFKVFVLRLEDGYLPVYKEFWNSEEDRKREDIDRKVTTVIKEVNTQIYVKNKEGIFIEVSPVSLGGGGGKFKKFLKKQLNLEDAFLQTVDNNAHFDDAEEILFKYNEWKKTK